MNQLNRHQLVLAIYPNSRGFAFAAFESSLSPFDWGIKEVRGVAKNARCLSAISAMIERIGPSVIVLQDMSRHGPRRALRLMDLNIRIAKFAAEREIPAFSYSRASVRQTFGGLGATKDAIARSIVAHIPAFERYLPRVRKPWMSEDARMGLFDATALAITFFQRATQSETGMI